MTLKIIIKRTIGIVSLLSVVASLLADDLQKNRMPNVDFGTAFLVSILLLIGIVAFILFVFWCLGLCE